MSQELLNELSRSTVRLTRSDDPFVTWNNSILSVVTEKSLYILKFHDNLQSFDKKINCSITDISCPKTSPATSFFSKKIVHKLGNFDFTQLIINASFWPHNDQLMEEMACIVSAEWSPPALAHNEGMLAILNSVGNVELFEECVCGYKSVLNISSLIEENHTNKISGSLQNIEEVKAAVFAVETAAICWAGEHQGNILFITAQKNGDLHFWQLQKHKRKIKIEHLKMQKSNCDGILTIKWIPLTSEKFIIIFANELGQLFVNKYEWDSDKVKLVKSNCVWPYKDRMIVKHFKHSIVDNRIMVFCNKNRHLIVLLMDDNGKKLSEYVKNISDYRITVISETNNEFYVGTINCNVFKVKTSISGNDLNVNLEQITLKENLLHKELYGVQFSKNNVMCALGVVDKRLMIKNENPHLDVVFLCPKHTHDEEIKCLINNPTKQLTDYWDCIEIIRYKTLKLKSLPFIDFNQLYTDASDDIYKLKVYYILLVLYCNLDTIIKNNSTGWLPETSIDVVRDKIMMLHAKSVMTKIFNKLEKNDYLIDLEKESFVGAKKFVSYYCQKYEIERSTLVTDHVWNVLEIDCEYICQCCDKKIIGFTCVTGHLNMFCALTLTPIETDSYLCCKGCGILARIELESENPLCLFCDLYLNNSSITS